MKAVQISLQILMWVAIYAIPFLVMDEAISFSILKNDSNNFLHVVSTLLLVAYAYLNYYLLIPKLYLRHRYIVYAVIVIAAVLVVIWFPQIFLFRPDGLLNQHPPFNAPHHGGPPYGEPPPGGPPPGTSSSMPFSKMSYNILLFVLCTFISISIRQQQQFLEVQKENLNSELSFLKAQINPHFLFNTLNSIYALSIQKSDDTPKAIIQLSELMRYLLKDAESDTVPLEKELMYISNYVALQQRRLGNTAKVEYIAPSNKINYRIAPLMLMSFVENAFKHGVNPDEDSAINIVITIEVRRLQMMVRNNKVTSINSDETMGIGIKNTVSRLTYLYPKKHTLSIEDTDKTYTVNLILELND